MRRSEINGDVWLLSPERTKNKHRHEVPLCAQALAIIDAMPLITGEKDFVFASSRSGARAISATPRWRSTRT